MRNARRIATRIRRRSCATIAPGLGPLVVRSSHAAQAFAGETLDLKRIASEGDVDAVLTGSILRAGEQVRLVAQLVETPGGARSCGRRPRRCERVERMMERAGEGRKRAARALRDAGGETLLGVTVD